jgi:1-deoxy-D-xylulose-5-phosphate reductoisomerase
MKRIAVLGSTGSIGTSTLDVIASHPERFCVTCLAAGRNVDLLRRQVVAHRPAMVAVADETDAEALEAEFPTIEFGHGAKGLERAACHHDVDMVAAALVGAVGLPSTMAAVRAGKDIALANKETLVVAGSLVMAEAEKAAVEIVPVDSEHSAVSQALRVGPREAVSRLVLTASGGPLRGWSRERLASATTDDVLAHPTWRMGPKITVDSATMMNKGLEIIEAHHLFAMPEDRIDVVVHPQSLVHSLVEYIDGTLIAQLSVNDMRLPILHALAWPERLGPTAERLELAQIGRLDFEPPDIERFPALALARAALRSSGEMPAVLNAANEVAVDAFLGGGCSFDRIADTISGVMDLWSGRNRPLESVEQALAADAEARRIATGLIVKYQGRSIGSN